MAVSELLLVPLQVLGTEEDVSVYDIADHPDFHFRTSDIVIRIWNSENGENDCENEVRRAAKGCCCFTKCREPVRSSRVVSKRAVTLWVFVWLRPPLGRCPGWT